MALTVQALLAMLEHADDDALVIIARFDGDEVHAEAHVAEDGKVVLREQGREFALVDVAARAAERVLEAHESEVAHLQDQLDRHVAHAHSLAPETDRPVVELRPTGMVSHQSVRSLIHEAISGALEPVRPPRELRKGVFADDPIQG